MTVAVALLLLGWNWRTPRTDFASAGHACDHEGAAVRINPQIASLGVGRMSVADDPAHLIHRCRIPRKSTTHHVAAAAAEGAGSAAN